MPTAPRKWTTPPSRPTAFPPPSLLSGSPVCLATRTTTSMCATSATMPAIPPGKASVSPLYPPAGCLRCWKPTTSPTQAPPYMPNPRRWAALKGTSSAIGPRVVQSWSSLPPAKMQRSLVCFPTPSTSTTCRPFAASATRAAAPPHYLSSPGAPRSLFLSSPVSRTTMPSSPAGVPSRWILTKRTQ